MSRRILAFVDDIYDDLELLYPKIRLEEEGWSVTVAGPGARRVYASKHGYPCEADAAVSSVNESDFDAHRFHRHPGVTMPARDRILVTNTGCSVNLLIFDRSGLEGVRRQAIRSVFRRALSAWGRAAVDRANGESIFRRVQEQWQGGPVDALVIDRSLTHIGLNRGATRRRDR